MTLQPSLVPAEEEGIRSSHEEESEIHPESPSTVHSPVTDTGEQRSDDKPASRYVKLKSGRVKEIISAVNGNSSETSSDSSEGSRRPWKTTLIRFGPLSGLFAMLLAIGSIIAALGVLAGSDHQPVSQWSAPPSTYLAIFTAIANLSVRYATFQGAIVAWWFRAYRGSTLGELHANWRAGSSFRGAITAGKHMGLLGLACVFSTLVVVDGPLLQRASTVITVASADDPVTLDVRMVPEIPTGSTGAWATAAELGIAGPYGNYNPAFNKTISTPLGDLNNDVWPLAGDTWNVQVVGPWYQDAPIEGVVKGCSKQCKANITAPALVPTMCRSETAPLFYNHTINQTSLLNRDAAPSLDQEVFLIGIFLSFEGSREVLNVVTQFGTSSHCEGTANYTICTLEPGIGKYEVPIEDDRILIDHLPKPKTIALANNAIVNSTFDKSKGAHLSTLGGIACLIGERWNTAIVYYEESPKGPIESLEFSNGTPQIYEKPGDTICPSYRQPLDDVLHSFNKLMFYSGASAAQKDPSWLEPRLDTGLQVNTTATGVRVGTESIFHTDYWFFLAAALIEVVCVALILPTYWGWWQIGRSISFSPLELAKAFEAPILEDYNSNAAGRDLAKEGGNVRFKYGLVAGEKSKLALRDAASVSRPQNGMRFDE